MTDKIDFRAIRHAHNLIDVAARYCELEKQGSEYKCLCPFHNDTKPSLAFFEGNDGIWRYNCFACEASGDVIDFVAGMNSVDSAEAARILTGGSMPESAHPLARPSLKPDESKCWEPIIPVPDDAPEYNPAETYNPKACAVRCHKPERIDPYFDGNGELICYVTRFTINNEKITPVITYCEGPGGVRRWCSKRMKTPYPLMGLDELAARPEAHVLVVSGEKCKVAASARLPKFVVVTTMGGDQAVLKNDLSPLKYRHVLLYADADVTGLDSMAEIGRQCDPSKLRHIDVAGQPKGHDIFDLLATGINDTDLLQWFKDHVQTGNYRSRRKLDTIKDQGAHRHTAFIEKYPPLQSNVVPIKKLSEDLGIPPEYSEDALAEAFSKKYHNTMIYVGAWGNWLEWRDNQWRNDETGLVLDLSRKICKKAATEAQKRADLGAKADKIATLISTRKMFANVAGICQSDRRHASVPSQFDSDPWILNTPAGVVELKTGKLRPANREDYSSKSTVVGPGGGCETWLKFLQTATKNDQTLIDYMQRLAGYCLTGSTAEQVFFFVYGTGGNGKGTFMNQISWLMNNYWRKSNMDTFTEQRFAKHSSEIAYFQGARLVTASETEEGKRWNESRIKEMTGGDPITAEHKYQNPFTFQPTFKLLFSGNHKPLLRNVDEAIRRRLHMIPFTVTVPAADRDGGLEQKLRAEGSGILQWAINGCLAWQKMGLNPPDRVLATTEEYFADQDTLGAFIDDRCELSPGLWAPSSIIYNAYTQWARSNGEYALPRRRFTDQLAFRGLNSVKRGGEMAVQGIAVRQLPESKQHWTETGYND
jgi:putative DNA primase/helicase